MKMLICGTLVPTKFETEIEYLSNAGNRFLMNCCRTLAKKNEIQVLSYVGVPVGNGTQQEIMRELTEIAITYYFASQNKMKCVWQYEKMMKRGLQERDCVVTYNTEYAWLFAPFLAKRMQKQSLLILADYSPTESYKSFVRKVYAYFQLKAIRKYDCIVGLSRNTEQYLKKNQKFICMEGGIDKEFYQYYDTPCQQDDGIIRFMYAGILEPVTGVEHLVQAFMQIPNENIRLFISGKGALRTVMEEAAGKDKRIVYLGCTSYSEYMENLKKADVLVNPRDMSLPENRNNFPSKIMEYLATGKTIISTKFPGWEKFSECITFCESGVTPIMEELKRVCGEDESARMVRHAKNRELAEQFVWERQIERVLKEMGE